MANDEFLMTNVGGNGLGSVSMLRCFQDTVSWHLWEQEAGGSGRLVCGKEKATRWFFENVVGHLLAHYTGPGGEVSLESQLVEVIVAKCHMTLVHVRC